MKVTTIRSEGLAHLSYFVSSDGEAMVIDPRRDCDIYVELSNIEEADILYIFETHRNEDYFIGSLELQNLVPSARIGHSKVTNFKYGDDSLDEADEFSIGSFKVRVLHTPGHTNDSVCYAVSDSTVGDDPILLFTGDTLFVNEVGRTDLVDIKRHEEMSRKLWHSLHEKVLPLGDGVIIYPGHGAGSVCGGDIGAREFSTIGYEKKFNRWLSMHEEEFVENKLNQKLTLAPYFKRCEKWNTEGPPLLADMDPIRTLDVRHFEAESEKEATVILDTRPSQEFVKEHIPRSLSMDKERMGLFAGWVLSPEDRYLLALDSPMDLEDVAGLLYRVGIDSITGYLNGGYPSWKASGRKTDALAVYSVDRIRSGLSEKNFQLIDVRQPHETTDNYIVGSISLPLTEIDNLSHLNKEQPTITICPSAVRGTTGASILKRAGFKSVGISEIGLKAWISRGIPLT